MVYREITLKRSPQRDHLAKITTKRSLREDHHKEITWQRSPQRDQLEKITTNIDHLEKITTNRRFNAIVSQLKMHYFSGGAFESLISSQLLKKEKYI